MDKIIYIAGILFVAEFLLVVGLISYIYFRARYLHRKREKKLSEDKKKEEYRRGYFDAINKEKSYTRKQEELAKSITDLQAQLNEFISEDFGQLSNKVNQLTKKKKNGSN